MTEILKYGKYGVKQIFRKVFTCANLETGTYCTKSNIVIAKAVCPECDSVADESNNQRDDG